MDISQHFGVPSFHKRDSESCRTPISKAVTSSLKTSVNQAKLKIVCQIRKRMDMRFARFRDSHHK